MVFFGTPDFAVPTLRSLMGGRHDVAAVVSQPDRRRGRGRKTSPSPVAECALAADLPLLRPEKVGAPEVAEALHGFACDVGVVVAFGQFLPKRIRELPRLGYLINGHASLLPRHRGAAPIAHAILAGDAETGISVMRVEKEMDAGPTALMKATPIGENETCGELTTRLGELTAIAIGEGLDAIADGSVAWTEQDHTRATVAPKIERSDAELDWDDSAVALARRVRAMAPKPGAFTEDDGDPLRILAAEAVEGAAPPPAGHVTAQGDDLLVATGEGWLRPLVLQRAGGKPLKVGDFQRGRGLTDGARLGTGASR